MEGGSLGCSLGGSLVEGGSLGGSLVEEGSLGVAGGGGSLGGNSMKL